MRPLASQVLGLPVRIAQPESLVGMTDKILSPAYSTSVGLLHWAVLMTEFGPEPGHHRPKIQGGGFDWENVKSWLRRLLP
jgi:cell division protein FtsA